MKTASDGGRSTGSDGWIYLKKRLLGCNGTEGGLDSPSETKGSQDCSYGTVLEGCGLVERGHLFEFLPPKGRSARFQCRARWGGQQSRFFLLFSPGSDTVLLPVSWLLFGCCIVIEAEIWSLLLSFILYLSRNCAHELHERDA